jgi:hypothetical protein
MLKYLELPKVLYEKTITSLREKGFICKELSSYVTLCEKRINEIQSMKYLIELAG